MKTIDDVITLLKDELTLLISEQATVLLPGVRHAYELIVQMNVIDKRDEFVKKEIESDRENSNE